MADKISVGPKPPKSAPAPAPSTGTGGGTASSGSTVAAGGGGKKAADPYAAYQKKQEAKEREAKRKAANRYLEQAATIGLQVKALRAALGDKGFKAALDQKLANVSLIARQQDKLLVSDYASRVDSLEDAAGDNERAAGAQSFANLANRGRERANALTEAVNQGAGESDLLRAQQMSLRNWNQNQNEINRSFFDTLTSVNSSLNDLTVDTRAARVNMATEAQADKDQLWSNYFDQRGETLTQLGNTLGQQAEYYGLAKEQGAGKKANKRRRRAASASGDAFMQAAAATGKARVSPGIDPALRNWQGEQDFEGRLNNTALAGAGTDIPVDRRPEGASLRKWA